MIKRWHELDNELMINHKHEKADDTSDAADGDSEDKS